MSPPVETCSPKLSHFGIFCVGNLVGKLIKSLILKDGVANSLPFHRIWNNSSSLVLSLGVGLLHWGEAWDQQVTFELQSNYIVNDDDNNNNYYHDNSNNNIIIIIIIIIIITKVQ